MTTDTKPSTSLFSLLKPRRGNISKIIEFKEEKSPAYSGKTLNNGSNNSISSSTNSSNTFGSNSKSVSSSLSTGKSLNIAKSKINPLLQKKPVGLINTGVSCFLNSVLQILTHTAPLIELLLDGLSCNGLAQCTGHYITRNSNIDQNSDSAKSEKKRYCIVCVLQNHFKSFSSSSKAFRPRYFILTRIASHFREGRMEDSHEFLTYLLDTLVSLFMPNALSARRTYTYSSKPSNHRRK